MSKSQVGPNSPLQLKKYKKITGFCQRGCEQILIDWLFSFITCQLL